MSNNHFVGMYVEEVSSVLVASVLSRQHLMLLAGPGVGKTEITVSAAEQWVGDKRYFYTALEPSSKPEEIKGASDPAEFLRSGKLIPALEGTAHDPCVRLVILDEIGRASNPVFDVLLKTLKPVNNPNPPTVWGIANFMVSNERVAALIDRFALWLWIQPGTVDIAKVVHAQLHSNGSPKLSMAGLPTWAEVEDIHKATPGANAEKAISDLLGDLAQEAAKNGRRPNHRTVAQWTHILFRTGVWHSGSADFAVVPEEATKLLRYAWPATTAEEAGSWAKIAASVVDIVGAALENALAQVASEMRKVARMDASQRTGAIPQLATLMQSTQATLQSLAGEDDNRVKTAVTQMNTWLAAAIQGKEIE